MKKVIAIIAVIIIAALPIIAGASSVSVSAGGCKVGDSLSVEVVFRNSNIGAVEANFTYDSSKLDFVGGSDASSQSAGSGKIVLYSGSAGLNSLSSTLNFKAKSAGNAVISVSSTCILSFDEEVLENCSSSCTVTIDSGSTPTKTAEIVTVSPSKKTAAPSATKKSKATVAPSAKATKSASPSPSQAPDSEDITVYVDGEEITMAEAIPGDLPKGFHISYTVYGGRTVETAYNAETDTTLAYLYENGKDEGCFFRWEKNGDFSRLINVNMSIIVLPVPDDIALPELLSGLQRTELTLKNGAAEGYILSENEALLYAICNGDCGWYLYNSSTGALQSYHEPISITVNKAEAPTESPEKEPEPDSTAEKSGSVYPFTQKNVNIAAMVLFAAAAISVIIIFIVAISRLSKKTPKGKH